MLQRLRKNRLKHKDSETNIESPLDSVGVEERKSKKLQQRLYHSNVSNHISHIDGYDKLKPYEMAMNAAVDGFSRKIL